METLIAYRNVTINGQRHDQILGTHRQISPVWKSWINSCVDHSAVDQYYTHQILWEKYIKINFLIIRNCLYLVNSSQICLYVYNPPSCDWKKIITQFWELGLNKKLQQLQQISELLIQKMMIGLNEAKIMMDNPECGSGNFDKYIILIFQNIFQITKSLLQKKIMQNSWFSKFWYSNH